MLLGETFGVIYITVLIDPPFVEISTFTMKQVRCISNEVTKHIVIVIMYGKSC